MADLKALATALGDLEEDDALDLAKAAIDEGVPAADILAACQDGMAIVGDRFEQGEYYVSDLMMSGEIFNGITELLTPTMTAEDSAPKGTVILGTVKGDIHDIGKDIVGNMLKAANFNVVDLGVDVESADFIAAVKEHQAPVLALSGLLTLAFDSMKEVIGLLDEAGLRGQVKVMIGGGPVDANVCQTVGADDWSNDAQKAVRLANQWIAA